MVDSHFLPWSMFGSPQNEPALQFEQFQPENNPNHLEFFGDFVNYIVNNAQGGTLSPIERQISGFKHHWYTRQYNGSEQFKFSQELDADLLEEFDKNIGRVSGWLSTLFAAVSASGVSLDYFFNGAEERGPDSDHFIKRTQLDSHQHLPHGPYSEENHIMQSSSSFDILESLDNTQLALSFEDNIHSAEKPYPSPTLTVLSSPQNYSTPLYGSSFQLETYNNTQQKTLWRSPAHTLSSPPQIYINPPHSHVTPLWLETQANAFVDNAALVPYAGMQAHAIDCCRAIELHWFHEFIQGWLRENSDAIQEKVVTFVDENTVHIRKLFHSLKDDSDAIDRGKISCKALLKYADVEFYTASVKVMFEIDKRIRLGPVKANGDKSLTDRSLVLRVDKVCNYFRKCKNSVVRIMKPAFLTDVVDMPDRMVERFDTNAEGNTKKAEKRKASSIIPEITTLMSRRRRRTSMYNGSTPSTPEPEELAERPSASLTARPISLRRLGR